MGCVPVFPAADHLAAPQKRARRGKPPSRHWRGLAICDSGENRILTVPLPICNYLQGPEDPIWNNFSVRGPDAQGWQGAPAAHLAYHGLEPHDASLASLLGPFRSERRVAGRVMDFVRNNLRIAGFDHVAAFQACPGFLHAKGVVTPLGIITGSTNITHSGLYAQSQNANYFAYGNADYAGNRTQLLGRYEGLAPVQRIP